MTAGDADAGAGVAVFTGQVSISATGWVRGHSTSTRLGKESEERMTISDWILLDRCAESPWEMPACARATAMPPSAMSHAERIKLAVGQHGQQCVQIGLGVQIERRRLAPDAAQNRFGILRRTKDDQFGVCGRIGLFRSSRDHGASGRTTGAMDRHCGERLGGNGTGRFGSGSSPAGMGQSSRMASPAL